MTKVKRKGPPARWGNPKGDPEKLDPTPMAVPMGYSQPPPLQDLIAKMVRTAIEIEKGEEFETMDEAEDFEEEESDLLDMSPYEFIEIQEDYDPPTEPEIDQFAEPERKETGDLPDPKAPEPESHRQEIIPQPEQDSTQT